MNKREREAIAQLLEALTSWQDPEQGFQQTARALGSLVDTPFPAIFALPEGFPGPIETINNKQPDMAASEVSAYIHLYPAGPFLAQNLEPMKLCAITPIEVIGRRQWEETEYYHDFLRHYGRKDQVLTFLRNSHGETRWMLTFCHNKKNAFPAPIVKLLDLLAPRLGRAFENLAGWKARWNDYQALTACIEEPVAAISFSGKNRVPKLAAVSGGAAKILCLGETTLSRNIHLQEFFRNCVRAQGPDAGTVLWTARDGSTFRLWSVQNSNRETLLVRFEPLNNLPNSNENDFLRGKKRGLTTREAGVFVLMARGLGNKEIARDLKVSEFTARAHVRNIFSKLKVSNRVEAVNAVRNGLE